MTNESLYVVVSAIINTGLFLMWSRESLVNFSFKMMYLLLAVFGYLIVFGVIK